MNFKDIVQRDIHAVFLNLAGFAELRTIRYDGKEYPDVPVVLDGPVEKDREQLADDHVQGLHLVTATLYCAREDLGGELPKQDKSLEVSPRDGGRIFQKYYIVASTCDMGMLHVELEAIDE